MSGGAAGSTRTEGAGAPDGDGTDTPRGGDRAGRWRGILTGRMSAWVVLALVVVLSGLVLGLGSGGASTDAPESVPADAESARVDELVRTFPDAGSVPAVLAVSRDNGRELGQDGIRAAAAAGQRAAQVAGSAARPPIPSQDGAAALVLVPVDASVLASEEGRELVADMRSAVTEGLDEGMRVEVTGAPGFAADTAAAFEGADVRLLVVTALVVAVLLVVTYRSPVLWLVPLAVVAVADRVAAIVSTAVGELTGLSVDASTAGITSVLVFGAGTDYALLLVSRYREELRRTPDRRRALRRAYRGALPAILTSNLTVVLALLTLLLAALPNYRALGMSGAVGLLVALAFALVALPAALAVCGRGLFWPFVPRPAGTDGAVTDPAPDEQTAADSADAHDPHDADGFWGRLARAVSARAPLVLGAGVVVLLLLSLGLVGTRVGLSQSEQFRTHTESAAGLETVEQHFPAGSTDPVVVVARTDEARPVLDAVDRTEGVDSVRQSGTSPEGWTRFDVVVDAAPATERSEGTVRAIRDAVHAVPGAEAGVGGSVAQAVDAADANRHDLLVVVPLVLLVVLLVLVVVLRALVAPLLVLCATVLSSLAALGLGTLVTTTVFGFPGLDLSVPLFAFLFLVALGVDYSIFLVLRAREEAVGHGTREGMLRAVALTGGVITSAGVVLAAVFVVLGVLPLVVLTQVGVIVALGVLLDTLLVRTVLVPAAFTLLGDRVWWPSRAARGGVTPAG